MASADESQALTVLGDYFYDDPSQLSQALRQRAGSHKPLHFTTSTESQTSPDQTSFDPAGGFSNTADAPPQQGTVEPTHLPYGTSPRRVPAARHGKPRLPKSFSAPRSTGYTMAKEAAERMVQTFAGVDSPGDTQPDSQMNIHTSIALPPSTISTRKLSPRSLFEPVEEEEDGDSPTDGVDGVESSQDQHIHSPTVTSPTVIHDEDHQTLPQFDQALTSPLKFETPALAGRKRDSYGQVLSSAMRTNSTTPGTILSTSAFFGAGFGNGGVGQPMSLTQAFNATQAGTSPLVGQPTEDPVFQRPSPNFTHARNSSPLPALSSPIKAAASDMEQTDPLLRSSSEPRIEYVTMKQSQERRKRETEDDDVETGAQDSWEEPSAAQKRLLQRKAREKFEREAAKSLSHISAPTPSSARSTKKRGLLSTSSKYSSPTKVRVPRWPATYGGPYNGDGAQPLPMIADGEDDSPDELSQNTPSAVRTARTPAHKLKRNTVEVPQTSSHPRRTLSGRSAPNSSQHQHSEQPQPGSQVARHQREDSKESVAITDSQPDTTAQSDSMPRPKSLRFPSSPSTNQYSINQTTLHSKTGYTSQRISSSIPLPPKSTPEKTDEVVEAELAHEGEERVPSSPPMVENEDEIVYDEHAYDEHSEDGAEEETEELQITNEDSNMEEEEEDDDDLPVTEHGVTVGERQELVEHSISDQEMQPPIKVDNGSDYEISETLDHGVEDDSHEAMPRMRRQNTIPETDMLDETQPSAFADPYSTTKNSSPISSVKAAQSKGTLRSASTTEAFNTAQEDQPALDATELSSEAPHGNSTEDGVGPSRVRSINDLAMPDTQHSSSGEVEMPQLSGVDTGEMDPMLALPSPLGPPSKKRKVTYTKKKGRGVPLRETGDSAKQSENLNLSPSKQDQQVDADSSPAVSTQDREYQGASAAVHVRQEAEALFTKSATLKSSPRPVSTKPRTQRKGALKPVKKPVFNSTLPQSLSKAPPPASASTTAASPEPKGESSHLDDENISAPPAPQVDVEMTDAGDEPDELAGPDPSPTKTGQTVLADSHQDDASTKAVLLPNRVFASWPGKHYYPATFLGMSGTNMNNLQIRYDDGTLNTLDVHLVRALDLRSGDHVKVDEQGMKKNNYVVVSFQDKLDDLNGEQFPSTDRLGYSTVILEEKQKESKRLAKARTSKGQISVPITKIYLTHQLWIKFKDRPFRFSGNNSAPESSPGAATPATNKGGTTPSFSRRTTGGPSLLKENAVRAGSAASFTKRGTTLFSNMAFAITGASETYDGEARDALKKTILSNGGQVLEDGFHELFDCEISDVSSSQSGRKKQILNGEAFTLKPEHKSLGFVALISDAHLRSPKYIQALALNVPCLHLRWIHDSLAASRPLKFAKYLLPAGSSTFLDPEGVVRSRMMTLYDPGNPDITFSHTISQRDLILRDQSVLFVAELAKKKGKEKKQPYIFLTHALGPSRIDLCADLAAAKDMLQDGSWDWVYVGDGPQGVANSATSLFGAEKRVVKPKLKGKGRRKKRDDSEESEARSLQLVSQGEIGGRTVKIMCDEFVIQSLILGALAED